MDIEKLSSNEIKIKNRQRIYQYIRFNGPSTKQDLVVALQLSLPTVTQNLDYLKKRSLIDGSKKITNTGGRNATAFTYLQRAKMAIGIYITAHHMNGVAVDLSGDVETMVREQVDFDLDNEAYLKKLGSLVERVKEEAGIQDADLLGVGISVPGLVSDDGETVIYGRTLNFTGKTRKEIAKYIPYPCRLVHDSYAAGYIEAWKNQEVRNAFYISLSNSVGGSIIIDHEIYEGDTQRGGEIGHMIVVPEGGRQTRDLVSDVLIRSAGPAIWISIQTAIWSCFLRNSERKIRPPLLCGMNIWIIWRSRSTTSGSFLTGK